MSGTYTQLDKTAEVVMEFNASGQAALNVYYVKGTAEWDATTLDSLITDFQNWENTYAKTYRHPGVTATRISAIDRSDVAGPRVDKTVNIVGTYMAFEDPNNVTLAISWRTAKRGRAYRGRTFHIGISGGMASANANDIATAEGLNLLAIYEHLRTGITANGGQLVVAHQVHAGARLAVGSVEVVTSCTLTDFHFDSMRRRLASHNRHR